MIALQKQIDAELAALESLGESTKDVRTGINATGLYWATPNGPVILFYTGRPLNPVGGMRRCASVQGSSHCSKVF